MIKTTPFLPGLSPVCGKEIVARFDGGRLSSDGGVLRLREIEARLGIADPPGGVDRAQARARQHPRSRMCRTSSAHRQGSLPLFVCH